ncbi:MAG: DUF2442 domain-containing protein [Candidatus Babeliales bacterium]
MVKKLKKLGKNTSTAEIQNISNRGIWIFVNQQEFFLSFEKYPWFKKATIDQIYDVTFYHGKHLLWPSLDVDLDINVMKNPEAYPLKYK